jgi:hypothetical protein
MRLIHGRPGIRVTRRTLPTRPQAPRDQHPTSAPQAPTPATLRRPGTPSLCPASSPRRRCWATVLLVLCAVAALALLGGSTARAETVTYVALAQTVEQVLTNIRNWIMGILAGIALVFFTIGGLRYLMAGGNPGEVDKAKDAFKASGIGFGLAALAPIAVEILKTIVGGL